MEATQRLDQLEKEYRSLIQRVDRLDQIEKEHDFTIRDSSVKIGIAEGLAETTFKELRQLSLDMHYIRAELKELRSSNDQHFERLEKKIDTQEEKFNQKFDNLEKLLKQVLTKLP